MLRFEHIAVILLYYLKGSLSQLNVCGRGSLTTRVVGGQDALAGAWPWQVSIQINDNHFCGGTLINKYWVLTAAHCTTSTSDLDVLLGKLTLQGSNPHQISRGVTKVVRHPGYNNNTLNNDIALLKLNASVTFTKYILPVCLAAKDSSIAEGTKIWITGWGDIGTLVGLPYPGVLQQAVVPIVGNVQCNGLLGHGAITKNMICAGLKEGGKDTCQGDSGGPLVIKQNGVWVQAGITSWGIDCALPNFPGVYTKVSQYHIWILTTISQNQSGFVKLQTYKTKQT